MSFGACRAIQFLADIGAATPAVGYASLKRLNVSATTSYTARASQPEDRLRGICPIVGNLRRVVLTNGQRSRVFTRIFEKGPGNTGFLAAMAGGRSHRKRNPIRRQTPWG